MSEPTRTTRVRSRRRLVTRAGLHASRPNRRLSSRSAPDLSPRPDVVELATGIAEAIGNRLVAQISSSIETLRLEMSSLATREPEAACRNEQGVRHGSLDTSGVRTVADRIPDGPAVVLSQLDLGTPGTNPTRPSLTNNQDFHSSEHAIKGTSSLGYCHHRSSSVSHCACAACPQGDCLDLRRRLPKLEIPHFTGNPMEWPMFLSAFQQSVHSVLNSDADRLCILRELLSPEIRKSMAKYLYDPRQYNHALEVLQRRFGDPQRVVHACLKSFDTLRPWSDFDYNGLRVFSQELEGIVSVLSLGGHEVEICSSSNVSTVVKKMPKQLRDDWGRFVMKKIKPRFPNLRDLSDWIGERREAADVVTDDLDSAPYRSVRSSYDKRRKLRVMAMPTLADTSVPVCILCNGEHSLPSCPVFIGMRAEQRTEVVRSKACCYRCLLTGHTAKQCDTRNRCTEAGCNATHHPMLHGAPRLFDKKRSSETARREQSKHYMGSVCNERKSQCLLPIVPLMLVAPDGRRYRTRALLDSGSEVSMLHLDVANALGLHGPKESCRFTTFYDQQPSVRVRRVSFKIASTDGLFSLNIEDAYAVPKLQLPTQTLDVNTVARDFPFLRSVTIDTDGPSDICLLIGMDYPAAHAVFESKFDRKNHYGPRAILTPFGWSIIGPLPCKFERPQERHCYRLAAYDSSDSSVAERLLDKFFNYELTCAPLSNDKPVTPDEKRAWQILEETTQFNGERYQVGLLWKDDQPDLPINRVAALRRFAYLERRLNADPEMRQRYINVMQEYISAGHARKLSPCELNAGTPGRTWWLPHHPVVNPNKPSKLRIVFDAAARFKGASLNSALLKGPDLIGNMVCVLLRFRLYSIAISSDITKMFHQVMVRPSDRSALRFVWKEPGSDQPISDYEMTVQIFGATSSPAVCAYALRRAAMDSGDRAEIITRQVIDHFYVDNWLSSFQSETEAVQVATELRTALDRAGFKLSQWASSNATVIKAVSENSLTSVNMDLDSVPVERTLGLTWDPNRDGFILHFNVQLGSRTKREVLRTIATMFDPLGFLEPVTLLAKTIMQTIWKSKIAWDDLLPPAIMERWHQWSASCLEAGPLIIRRCILPTTHASSVELHLFADASEVGYGAVAYLRLVEDANINVSFVMAKSRVAPIKPITTPRMELNAAVMAVRLMNTIKRALRLNFDQIMFHVDSTTVLRWISATSCRFHTYVRNRIGEIHECTVPDQWHYVRGNENPADDCSRGLFASEMHSNHRFLRGPSFLWRERETWAPAPELSVTNESNEDDPEIKTGIWTGVVKIVLDRIDKMVENASRLERLLRTTSYVLRFVSNSREVNRNNRRKGPLSVVEIDEAFTLLLRLIQARAFGSEKCALLEKRHISKGSSLLALTPFIDERGLLRVGGRLDKAKLPLDFRHPIIIPHAERLTQLIVLDIHAKIAHASTERTLHELRKRFWLPKGRRAIRRAIRQCGFCKKASVRPVEPFMAGLPLARVTPGLPVFTNCGVDYFGPFEVLVFRRRVKRWACMFTCLATRAVHLEMAYSLDTDSFLAAMFRFEQRRGTPAAYWSDNGRNFVGADRELKNLLQRLDQTKITERLSLRRVVWNFIPPSCPHMGGAWEALIRSVKRSLNVVLQRQVLTDEILLTAIVHVECIINGRPLTYLPSESGDPQPLTPNHLLMGRSVPDVAPDIITAEDVSLKKRWRHAQFLANQFWKRWIKEYLPTLISRKKWCRTQRNLQNGDVVIIMETDTPRGSWPLGKIQEVFPGNDGVVRSALVRTNGATVHRPATKLCLLESADEDVDSPSVHRAGGVAD